MVKKNGVAKLGGYEKNSQAASENFATALFIFFNKFF